MMWPGDLNLGLEEARPSCEGGWGIQLCSQGAIVLSQGINLIISQVPRWARAGGSPNASLALILSSQGKK